MQEVAAAPSAVDAVGKGLVSFGQSLAEASKNMAEAAKAKSQMPQPEVHRTIHASVTAPKPFGLVLCVLFLGLFGVLQLITGVILLVVGPATESAGRYLGYVGMGSADTGVYVTLGGLFQAVLGFLSLAASYGVGATLIWGRTLGVVLLWIMLAFGFLGMFTGSVSASTNVIKVAVLAATGATLWYLSRPEIRGRFV